MVLSLAQILAAAHPWQAGLHGYGLSARIAVNSPCGVTGAVPREQGFPREPSMDRGTCEWARDPYRSA